MTLTTLHRDRSILNVLSGVSGADRDVHRSFFFLLTFVFFSTAKAVKKMKRHGGAVTLVRGTEINVISRGKESFVE